MIKRVILRISPVVLILAAGRTPLLSQWLDYPTKAVPRTPEGKPNLDAPAPRTLDGKPDLSGMWGWETRVNCGAKCNDFQISREFMNIAATLNSKLPYKPGVAELVKNGRPSKMPIPMFIACPVMRRGSGRTTTTSGSSCRPIG
jgi:hypothetical protein